QSVAAWRAALLRQKGVPDRLTRDSSKVVGTTSEGALPGVGAVQESGVPSARNDPRSLARREFESMPGPATAATRAAGSRWLWVSGVAVVAVLAAALAFSGLFGSAWESVGVSEQERLQHYTQAKRLEGEIQALQERIAQSARAIEQEVREAESELRRLEGLETESVGTQLQAAGATLAELRAVADLQKRVVYASPRLAALQGEFNAGMALVDQRGVNNAQAIELLEPARVGYQQL